MQHIAIVTLPFFALVLCGFLAAYFRVLPESAIPGLNGFVLFFALPCLVFNLGASKPFGSLVDLRLVAIYAVCAILMIVLTVALTMKLGPSSTGVDMKNAAFGALVAAFPNTGFMGVPLLMALVGEHSSGPVMSTILVDLLLTSTVCIGLAQCSTQEKYHAKPSWYEITWRALKGPLRNPLPWAILAGGLMVASGGSLPGPLKQVVDMLANSASPVALFTIGAVLWRAGQQVHTQTPVQRYLPVALIKLLVHPALVWGVITLAGSMGFAVSTQAKVVLILVAALPSASNVSLLAERYNADNGRIARIVMASTMLAFVSFTLLAWTLGVTASSVPSGISPQQEAILFNYRKD
jgi:malonate transporter